MAIKVEYVLFAILGIVVLYALSRVRTPEVQQIPEFIGSGSAPQGESQTANTAAKLQAFNALASLGATQTESGVTRYQTDAQLEATRLASSVQQTLGLGEQSTSLSLQQLVSNAQLRIQELFSGTQTSLNNANLASQERQQSASYANQERLQAAGFDFQRFALPLNLDVTKYGLDSELQQYLAGLKSQETLYQADLANRLAQMQQQIAAVNGVGQTYRNQSLERQGTILNALSQIWGGGASYNYQSAFGKTNTSILQQLFPQGIGQTASSILGGFFGF